jgi:hypothetical protein
VTGMTTAVRETRTPNEVEAQRAEARERLDHPAPYERAKASAVLAAIAWLVDGGPAPITGGEVEPTERAIGLERRRAEDTEALALHKGLDGTFPGVVGVVLSWYHRRAYTEAPY